jgi:single-strand DNA-binding protein
MSDLNSVVLVGRLVRDPELRYTPEGAAVCEMTLASNRRWTKKDGEKAEDVLFVDVVTWNRTAEVVAEYAKKGRAVAILGTLIQDRWEDETTGQKRSKIRIKAHTVQLLGGGSKDAETPEAESVSVSDEPLVVPDSPPPPPSKPAAVPTVPKGRQAGRR